MDTLSSVIDKLNERTKDSPLFYISNDPERGLGLESLLNNYYLCYIDLSQYTEYFKQLGIKHFCLENYRADEFYRSAGKLIKAPEFLEYFNHYSFNENFVQTFKISPQFEFGAKKLGAVILNTSAMLNRKFEDKLSQYKELSTLDIRLPKTLVAELGVMKFKDLVARFGPKFVMQFDRGHTGSGTVFIEDEKSFLDIQKEFPMRHVRVSEFVNGRAYTINACVGEKNTYLGGLSAQITGVEGLTPAKGGTIGNDFMFRNDLTHGTADIVKDMYKIADHMRKSGYRGLFGADIIVNPNGEHKIIEINARQPASIPMFTKMQILSGQIPLAAIHLMEYMRIEYDISAPEYNMVNLEPQAYSQVFIRPSVDMTINLEIPMGVYALKGDKFANTKAQGGTTPKFIYIDEESDKAITMTAGGFTVEHIQQGGFILLTQKRDRLIKQNTELARMQLKQGALDEAGNLKPWIKEILLAVKDYQL